MSLSNAERQRRFRHRRAARLTYLERLNAENMSPLTSCNSAAIAYGSLEFRQKERAMQPNTFASFDELKAALGLEEYLAAVHLSPELATDILAHDPVNRKVRNGNLAKIKREIEGGYWDPRKSTPLRFLPTLRLADGQHRCRAVLETGITIVIAVCIVPDTVGVDEGAARTLVDHLQLSHNLDEAHAQLASVVTKALCHVAAAGNRDYLAFYQQHEDFIRDCAEKPLAWLGDQQPSVAAVFKPAVLGSLRARAIFENSEPAESVDQLLLDAINGGATAPEGSPRRALAKQLFDAMQEAFTRKKAVKRKDMLEWVLAALRFEREGVLKNILTARRTSDKKRQRKPGASMPPLRLAASPASPTDSLGA